MNNQKLIMYVLDILRWRARHDVNARSRMAYANAYNLLVYAMRGNEEKINEAMEAIKND
jgi:hypothetical protein